MTGKIKRESANDNNWKDKYVTVAVRQVLAKVQSTNTQNWRGSTDVGSR